MEDIDLVQWLLRLRIWMDQKRRRGRLDSLRFNQPPYGDAYVTLDATSTSPAASFNENRVYLCGAQGGLRPQGIDRLIRLFEDRKIAPFFVWLSPGPGLTEVCSWLDAAGFSKVLWTRYPTLAATNSPLLRKAATDLQIREVDPQCVRQARDVLGEHLWSDYAETAGEPGFRHLMAFDGARPVATAVLVVFEGIGYLTFASTDPIARGRGAQQALIERRLDEAWRAGCRLAVSETLTMLPHSMSNLQRFGFVEIFDKLVYGWGTCTASASVRLSKSSVP